MTSTHWTMFVRAAVVLLAANLSWAQDQPPAAQRPAVAAQDQPGEAAPRLELSKNKWDFGTIWQAVPVSTDLTLKNVGNAALQYEIKKSCGCVLTKGDRRGELAPQESTTITVSYNSTSRQGPANQMVTLRTNDPIKPATRFQITGNVKPRYQLEPRDGLMFGRLMRDSAISKTVKITNVYEEKMNLKLLDGPSSPYLMELTELEPGMVYELKATTKPPLTHGVARANVELATGVADFPKMTITVHGYVHPRVQVSPRMFYVPKTLKVRTERRLRVNYQADNPVKILEVKSSVPDLITAEVLPPASRPVALSVASHELRVSLPPGEELPEDGAELIILTDAAEPEYARLVIPISNKPTAVRTPGRAGALTPAERRSESATETEPEEDSDDAEEQQPEQP